MAEVKFNQKAYCKMILHAVKYPHFPVNGILLAEKAKLKDSKSIPFVDCIPLFHQGIGLTPMIEVALLQIDCYCKEKGLVLAGYYQANVNYKDSNPDYFAYKIAEKLHENFNEAVLIMIDNKKLAMDCTDVGLNLYHMGDSKWKLRDNSSIHLEKKDSTFAALSTLLHKKSCRTLVDFDNHLDNDALSWENVSLNEEISRLL